VEIPSTRLHFCPAEKCVYFSELTIRFEAAACVMQKLVATVTED
jgi:hypothetical protein